MPEPKTQTTQDSSSSDQILASLTAAQRGEWLKTGNLPELAKPTVQAKEPEEPEKPSESAKQAEPAPVTEPGKSEEQKAQEKIPESRKSGAKVRTEELQAEIDDLHSKLRERAKLRQQLAEPTAAEPAKPAKQAEDADKAPELAQFANYEDFMRANIQYEAKKLIAAEAGRIIKELEAKQTQRLKDVEVQQRNREVESKWKERVQVAVEKHGDDFVKVALDPKLGDLIPAGSVLDAFILDSELGADILYHLGKNPAEVVRIGKLNPLAQARELVKLEISFSGGAPPLITKAPPPPKDVTGTAASSSEPEDMKALKAGDFGAYKRAANARDIASRRGK